MGEYDITEAFDEIEKELIAFMILNMDRHKAEETELEIEWAQWQVLQIQALEEYKVKNQKKYGRRFKKINQQIDIMIKAARESGGMEQEIDILEAIKKGFTGYRKASRTMTAQFFKINDRKIEALIQATTSDMKKAETAILRMANDKYRQIIFNAQVYANIGAGTYEKAVDMATKDMLAAGLTCIEYKNGARHNLKDYADMVLRTACKRAYLTGEGEKRMEWGISTVIMNKRGNPCPKCLPFCGKVLIDDVWSGGKKSDGPYPLMSTAIAAGLYHPRCKDAHTTYFEGISTPGASYTKEELAKIENDYRKEQKQQYAKRQTERFGRLAEYSLDKDNKKRYTVKEKLWKKVAGNKTGVSEESIETLLQKSENPEFRDKVKREIQRLPQEQVDFLNKNGVQIVQENGLNSYYHPLEKKIRLIPEFEDYECIHELAHAIEDLTDVWEDKEFRQIIEEITSSHTAKDVIYDTENYAKPIYRIEDVRFISEYQGRIYEEGGILTKNGLVNSDAMWDYFSEGYACFFKNPSLLKERDYDLYSFIKRKVVNEVRGD